jgi:hypothetical protein
MTVSSNWMQSRREVGGRVRAVRGFPVRGREGTAHCASCIETGRFQMFDWLSMGRQEQRRRELAVHGTS